MTENQYGPHIALQALSPPPGENRLWKCVYCGATGRHDDLLSADDCTYEHEPCEHCGRKGECAPDCPGMMSMWTELQKDPEVHVSAGLLSKGVKHISLGRDKSNPAISDMETLISETLCWRKEEQNGI